MNSPFMEFGHSRLTGQPYARCECGWTCVYWEDEIDLIHECEQGFGNDLRCSNCGDEWSELDSSAHCDECAMVFLEAK